MKLICSHDDVEQRLLPTSLFRCPGAKSTISETKGTQLLKGVAEAIEHCTWTQVWFTVVTAIYALEMAASAKARLTFRIRLCRTSQMYG
jgi:hypothetical protein